jgi:preprotein translocase subunit Sec63
MNEAVAIASELWSELKRYVNTVDRDEAAETIVAVLIDNDCDVDDIKNSFKGDSDIKRALTAYLDNDKSFEDDEEESDEEEDYHEDDWEN